MSRHERFATAGAAAPAPLACVLGGMDLIRPLGLAGIRCIAIARPGSPALYSRFNVSSLPWPETAPGGDLIDALERLAAHERLPPVLFYDSDAQLLLISRHRERLARTFRFVIADAALIEDLVDKARFEELARRLDLPVPPTQRIHPASEAASVVGLRFPLIVKPLTRGTDWETVGGEQKALRAETSESLSALWPRLAAAGSDFLAQEEVIGPESAIESYHVYVDRFGTIAAEFTGAKIRTYPPECGHSTALTTTAAADVAALGRNIVRKLNLSGVAKLDFKRAPDGRLRLLEVNPRFNLWHHLGAAAGVNIPALVYADLTARPRPKAAAAAPDTRWCAVRDFAAARAAKVSVAQWLSFARSCEARSAVALDDPMPVVRGGLHRLLQRTR
jgi:predicted ATP-grasp superfamily ATP-dependent carboligase